MARFNIVAALMFLAALSNALPTANDFPGSVDEAMNKAMEAADQALEAQQTPAPTPASGEDFFPTPSPTPFGLAPTPTPSPSAASNPLNDIPIIGPLAAALLGGGGQ
ncbi:hypothetical protein DTO271D3_933 [Paecilomyces variotii]|nr:hypothetical protein DTO032I3_8466 [Paecilomyces variotii]KAJ9277701.1 hypothetical protein DTO021D3_5535 [Paecilomyces variotii]KAJ9318803.1 hypothetical protein DTO271D3_933 [Paecilomyces variotii]KAJ9338404.1 hypothetical protein DTO027B6_9044 [Paecilomyces variotii]KAJ9354248.1 hypothetical protein DTO027B9_4874 [Paecilomyces variotii]